MKNLILYLRTKDSLLNFMLSGNAGSWEIPADKDHQISQVKISNWDGTQCLTGEFNFDHSSRQGSLLLVSFSNPRITVVDPPLVWIGDTVIRYENLANNDDQQRLSIVKPSLPSISQHKSSTPGNVLVVQHSDVTQNIAHTPDDPEPIKVLSKRLNCAEPDYISGFRAIPGYIWAIGITSLVIFLSANAEEPPAIAFGLVVFSIFFILLVFYKTYDFNNSLKKTLSWLQTTSDGNYYLNNYLSRNNDANELFDELINLSNKISNFLLKQPEEMSKLGTFSEVRSFLDSLEKFLDGTEQEINLILKKEEYHRKKYEDIYRIENTDPSLNLYLFTFRSDKLIEQFKLCFPDFNPAEYCKPVTYYDPSIYSGSLKTGFLNLSLSNYVEHLKKAIDKFMDDYEYKLSILPTSREHQKALLKDINALKDELKVKKREIKLAKKSIRESARQASTSAGTVYVGVFMTKRYNSKLAAAQRRAIRAKKDEMLGGYEQQEAEIDKEILRLDKLAMFVKSFND